MPVGKKFFGGHDNKKMRWRRDESSSAAMVPDMRLVFVLLFRNVNSRCWGLSVRQQQHITTLKCFMKAQIKRTSTLILSAAAAHCDSKVLRGGDRKAADWHNRSNPDPLLHAQSETQIKGTEVRATWRDAATLLAWHSRISGTAHCLPLHARDVTRDHDGHWSNGGITRCLRAGEKNTQRCDDTVGIEQTVSATKNPFVGASQILTPNGLVPSKIPNCYAYGTLHQAQKRREHPDMVNSPQTINDIHLVLDFFKPLSPSSRDPFRFDMRVLASSISSNVRLHAFLSLSGQRHILIGMFVIDIVIFSINKENMSRAITQVYIRRQGNKLKEPDVRRAVVGISSDSQTSVRSPPGAHTQNLPQGSISHEEGSIVYASPHHSHSRMLETAHFSNIESTKSMVVLALKLSSSEVTEVEEEAENGRGPIGPMKGGPARACFGRCAAMSYTMVPV
ncbi:hypothetical protein ARMSODRAFT_982694 [Armillaria solidipes]|uniref:Uncharacterized protein n=1 Tax=Armillaria solidipes TaxID=1076256 RepID=A0A2H3AQI7_9AGAR|nr:hypothetical protein ARMSODRAFT_982694 [Armillaria solidipes]